MLGDRLPPHVSVESRCRMDTLVRPLGLDGRRRPFYRTLGLPACWLLVAGSLSLTLAADIDPEGFRPVWQVGQRWTVETESVQIQVRREATDQPVVQKVRWQFHVQATEPLDGRDCFKLAITCASANDQPATVLWVDRQTMTLRQLQTQLQTPDGRRTVTESYRADSGQPFPAFAPLSVPPLELPLFLAGTKGTQTFSYEASSGPPGVKAVGDLGFAFSVRQDLQQVDEDQVKELLPADFTKGLEKKPILEVRLKAGRSQVRQLWQPGLPWPVFSDNGAAKSRLVK